MAAKLIIKDGPQYGQESQLDRFGSFSIGRSRENDLKIVEKAISREHCRIDYDGEYYWLVDCGSHNGTHVNGERVSKCLLYDGDVIKIGHVELVFSGPQRREGQASEAS
ncbi:MAG: FHA domain-containing protein [Planctomycetota bacterium]|jgi:pSer/pThr/pTyr-binding forkhead associated (FHA) protein